MASAVKAVVNLEAAAAVAVAARGGVTPKSEAAAAVTVRGSRSSSQRQGGNMGVGSRCSK